MHMRKQTTASPEPMPMSTARSRKNCSSRRLKRCGASIARKLRQYWRRVGVETAGLMPLASLGFGDDGFLWTHFTVALSCCARVSSALSAKSMSGQTGEVARSTSKTNCMVGSSASGFFRKACSGADAFCCRPVV